MKTSRRDFLSAAAAAGLAAPLAAFASGQAAGRQPEKKIDPREQPRPEPPKSAAQTILILGGTGFLGPAVLDAARARGHVVTLFNRGKTEKRRPGRFDDVEKLYGNRDPNLRADDADEASPKGLTALRGDRRWDAVVDTSGYFPRIVRTSAEMLAPRVGRYVFISSVSVYTANDTPDADESAEVGSVMDPESEKMGAQMERYGPLKAMCEKAAEAAMPGRVANIRPGYIVGRGDPSGRFTYWPVRLDRARSADPDDREVLAPGTPMDPVQIIDVRDLGEWIVRLVEDRTVGVFNACGPEKPATMAEMLEACRSAAGAKDAQLAWAEADFLEKRGVGFPIWVPPTGETAGFHRRSNAAAARAGLKCRRLEDTAKDTLAWFKGEPEERRKKLVAGPSPEQERAALAAWKAITK